MASVYFTCFIWFVHPLFCCSSFFISFYGWFFVRIIPLLVFTYINNWLQMATVADRNLDSCFGTLYTFYTQSTYGADRSIQHRKSCLGFGKQQLPFLILSWTSSLVSGHAVIWGDRHTSEFTIYIVLKLGFQFSFNLDEIFTLYQQYMCAALEI